MRTIVRRAAFGSVVILGLAVPVRFDAETGVAVNRACAGIGCCFELGSFCGPVEHMKPHQYTSEDGSCP